MLSLDGVSYALGDEVELSPEDAAYLASVGAVRLVTPDDLTPSPSPSQGEGGLTIDTDSEIPGELLETDGIGTGELIGGFVDRAGNSPDSENLDGDGQGNEGLGDSDEQPKTSKRGGRK